MMKTIVAPIDFSTVSRAVVRQAKILAQRIKARVILLNVIGITRPDAGLLSGIVFDDAKLIELQRKAAAARLERIARRLRGFGLPSKAMLDVGVAVERILHESRRVRAAYVVIGSHGHGALYDLVLGSTASGVIKRADCPVLVVPSARPAKGRRPRGKAAGFSHDVAVP